MKKFAFVFVAFASLALCCCNNQTSSSENDADTTVVEDTLETVDTVAVDTIAE